MQDSPDRHFNLTGASNFRDLGGYAGKDGRTVRWRHLFRSNHLGHVTDADIRLLRDIGLKHAFDFRGVAERAEAICGLPELVVYSLPIEPTVVFVETISTSSLKISPSGVRTSTLKGVRAI